MNTTQPSQRRFPAPSGMALLPALLILGLVTFIVLLFFSLSSLQIRSSAAGAASLDLRSLQDSAINMAIGQIRQGTTEPETLWLSQPGAIRTYLRSAGTASRIYKLYSAPDMVPAANGLLPAASNLETDVPSDWQDHPSTFADLNAPSIRTDGSLSFPILDPRLFTSGREKTPDGFSYLGNHFASGGAVPGVRLPSGKPDEQRLPMPVTWVYVLADGSLGTLDKNTSRFVPFAGQGDASAANPITARFAFWTDDETAKVNVNTASQAIPWDTPRCATPEDVAYAKKTPAKNEVQRFGGHPATTCLGAVLFPGQLLEPDQPANQAKFKQIYDLVPRVNADGGYFQSGEPAVSFDTDRLYPTIDEFLLRPDHVENPIFLDDPGRLRQLRFFLTANSRAPELTAAGTPRVCLWPVFWDDRDTHRTSFDRLIAFSTLMGKVPYHFRRNGPLTNMGEYNDYYVKSSNDPLGIGLFSNINLGRYLLRFADETVQGYPRTLRDKYDPDGLHITQGQPHNIGTGILCFLETIRQVNLHDTTRTASGNRVQSYAQPWNFTWIGSEVHGQTTTMDMSYVPSPFGGTAPTILRGQDYQVWTNGTAREYSVSEFGLVFCLAAEHKPDGSKFNEPLANILKLPAGYKAIQVAPVYEGFCSAQGYTMIAPSSSTTTRWSGADFLSYLRIRSSLGTRAAGGAITSGTTQASNNTWGNLCQSVAHLQYLMNGPRPSTTSKDSPARWWVGWGGSGGRWMYVDSNSSGNVAGASFADLDDPNRKIPTQYSRGFFLVPSADTQMRLSTVQNNNGTTKTLYFAVGNQRDGDFAGHKLLMDLPWEIVLPVPKEPVRLKPTFGKRYEAASANRFSAPEVIDPSDVVRTFIPRHGDHRLTYLREREGWLMDRNKRVFTAHPEWNPTNPASAGSATKMQIHSFVYPGGEPEPGAVFRRGLVRGETYASSVQPDFTLDPDRDTDYAANRPAVYPYSLDPTDTRDFDNGTGIAPDGAYWNKPDDVAQQWDGTVPPYFSKNIWDGVVNSPLKETIAPNQMIPSAVMFGSIPSAAFSGLQWTTYLFRPDITPGVHLGAADRTMAGNLAGAPPDHVILDWFWMPVVQPYAVSEPFSTAGKININYQIAPFSYIRRATGLHAVMQSERILSIPNGKGSVYKNYNSASGNTGWRNPIDIPATLVQWEDKYRKGELFRNASEICEQFLVPANKGISATTAPALRSAMTSFWNNHRLTGDNVLEKPYANIYPRLTTKSNHYRVHFLLQTLKPARSADPGVWEEGRGEITGELQGDALVERAIDPHDPALDTYDYRFIDNENALPLDNLYSFRIRDIQRFSR